MNLIVKSLSAVVLGLSAASAMAAPPAFLTTHNNTDFESNAFVAGTIPSPYPTAAHSTRQVFWSMVRFACYGHTEGNKCSALIKIATNTPNPIDIGWVSMNLDTGEITPTSLSAHGYTLTFNGPGEGTISKD